MEIVRTSKNKHIVILRNYRGILREYLFRDHLQLESKDDCLVEIFIEENKQVKKDILDEFDSLRYIETSFYNVFVRINLINRMICHNDKFILRELVNLYINDGFLLDPNFNPNLRIKLRDLDGLSSYLIDKITTN